MKRIYKNFDGLDIAFQGCFPADELEKLAIAKELAQKNDDDAITYLGDPEVRVAVRKTGKPPYMYVFDTGPDGEIWMVQNTDDQTDYGIFISVKSLSFALYGYEGVKERIICMLKDIGAKGDLLERINRVDFCVDFVTDHFTPNPQHFVCHGRSTKRGIGKKETVDLQTVERGYEYESIMIGKMPGKQVTLYNKSREVHAKNKPYWWDFWRLDQKSFTGQVWRVELRASRNEIDRWQAKRFEGFEAKIGDLFEKMLDNTRYVVPNGDSNVSRWPKSALWKEVRAAVKEALHPYSSGLEPETIKEVLRYEVRERYVKQIISLIPGLAVTLGQEAHELSDATIYVRDRLLEHNEDQPDLLAEKFRRVKERLVFLDEEKPEPATTI